MVIKYGIMVIKKDVFKIKSDDDILHFVGYERKPLHHYEVKLWKQEIEKELNETEEFEHDLNDCNFIVAPKEYISYIQNIMNNGEKSIKDTQ